MEKIELQNQKRKFIEKELRRVLSDIDNPTEDGKRRIQDKILSFSMWGAFMTRDGKRVYKQNITGDEKIIVRRELKEALLKMELNNCTDKNLSNKIKNFSEEISRCQYNYLLEDACFRVGISQKLINLYLKYRWCLGWSPEPPPHCPFDGQVIAYLQKNVSDDGLKQKIQNIRWTKMGSKENGSAEYGVERGIKDYQSLVEAAKKVYEKEGCQSIAEWELKFWNEKNK